MARVHILDDTSFILDLLAKMMPEHEVYVFTNPERFIASINETVNVIITDLKVARYDAISNIYKFKKANLTAKIIVMSAYFDESILLQLIDAHIYKAVKKTHEEQWFREVVDAVNK